MAKIESITDEQMPILDAKAKEWAAIGLATGPMDIEQVVKGVSAAYQAADLTPPLYYVYLKSPYQGAVGTFVLKQMFATLANMQSNIDDSRPDDATQVYDKEAPMYKIMDEVWSQLVPQFQKLEGTDFPDPTRAYNIFRRAIHETVSSHGMKWESSPIYGSHDASWLAFYDTLGALGIPETVAPMQGMMDVAKTAGWWWPLTDAVVVTERPMAIHQDDEGRLHSDTTSAISYSDGWALWASHGVIVTQQIIEAPHTLTVDQIITESNAEVKRVMLERYGFEAFMRNAKAERIDASDFGTLWKADAGEEEPLVMVEVVCPSTDHKYMLRVPPTMTRAREAVAWTFDFQEPEYNPVIQT